LATANMTVKRRLLFMLITAIFMFMGMIGRVGWLQFVRGEELQKKAVKQWTLEIPVEPKRGSIYDRNKKELAISASVDTVVAYPPEIKDYQKTAELLAPILGLDVNAILEKIKSSKGSVYLKRKVDQEISDKVRSLKLEGIGFTEESKRYYPDRNLAAHVLGFAGIDSQGLDGVELVYDKFLKGFPGSIVSETDALSRKLPFGSQQFIPPKDGLNLVLSIDKVIQHFAERELERAMVKHQAKKACLIAMDPNTGEILALVNKPDYDLNKWSEVPQKIWRNFAVSDSYEPGSTFKVVTASSALEEGTVRPEDRFFDPGYVVVSGVRIRCWRSQGHGSQSFMEVVQNSCNPGFISVGMKLGKENFTKYIKAFGFGQSLGIDLPGEAKGIFNPDKIGPVELATISFGQGISVTPIQLITAVSAIANGGLLMKPHVALRLEDANGNTVNEFKPEVLRQVISKETSDEMREILASVVSDGTGASAKIEGYKVAGKTGTAEKYIDGKYISSFLGFAPADNPKIAMLVIIDEPVGAYYGGQTAAPVFQRVMADSLNYLGIKPEHTEAATDGQVVVPNVKSMYVSEASSLLVKHGLNYKIEGSGKVVMKQEPSAGVKTAEKSVVVLTLGEPNSDGDSVIVPNIMGKTIKEAGEMLAATDLKMQITGSGVAVKQEPAAGEKLEPGETVRVFFEPPNAQ
jgi:stage V sporulation protein D (sporulation-specific penicillin-binding protein)